MSSYLVNNISGIENKRYLELGVYNSRNFNSVLSRDKVSVDTKYLATFQGTTDNYFLQLSPNEKFDVVYIDACHQWPYVLRDFNNSLKHLNPGGYIFVHDLIPGSLKLTASHYCGDGFKVLYHILKNQRNDYEMYSLDSDYGVTVFLDPTTPIAGFNSHQVQYSDFQKLVHNYKVYSRGELQLMITDIGEKRV
jgi:hypothetical protein